jgi:hypothetical protein
MPSPQSSSLLVSKVADSGPFGVIGPVQQIAELHAWS